RKNCKAFFVATRDIAVSRVLFLHKHDCSALRQQLRLLLERLGITCVTIIKPKDSKFRLRNAGAIFGFTSLPIFAFFT
ncbi:hypothetical protein L9F63_019726, partial [Diploptera punctata]